MVEQSLGFLFGSFLYYACQIQSWVTEMQFTQKSIRTLSKIYMMECFEPLFIFAIKSIIDAWQDPMQVSVTFFRMFIIPPWHDYIPGKEQSVESTQREKSPNTEFFPVFTFLYSVRIRENTDQKKLRIETLFTQWDTRKLKSNPIKFLGWVMFYKKTKSTTVI